MIASSLADWQASDQLISSLCDSFKRDNDKFSPSRFREYIEQRRNAWHDLRHS